MLIRKVVKFAMKVKMVQKIFKNFRNNWIKMEQNGIDWNYSSNQKMFITKVVRLAMKVKLVKKFFEKLE